MMRDRLGRTGDALPTARVLELAAAHAQARDAVHDALDHELVATALGEPVVVVDSAAGDRVTYLQRPDLGRRLAPNSRDLLVRGEHDLAVVLADGLSARALLAHAPALLHALRARLQGWDFAPLVLARQGRVAVGDEIGQLLGARTVLVLLGERPGLSAADSLGAYLTWDPAPGRRDAERNCVSNIRPPHGLGIEAAAQTLASLLTAARTRQVSGVALKDDGRVLP